MDLPQSERSRWFFEKVRPHEPEVRAFVRRHFPTIQDIDDLIQAAYLKLMRARDAGTVFEPRAYLFTMVRNAAVDVFRRRRGVSLDELEETRRWDVVDGAPNAAESASHSEEIELLVEAMESLPERCREVLALRRLHGLSYREIADRLGISENTVNAQLALGLVRCRKYLAARGVVKAQGNDFRPL